MKGLLILTTVVIFFPFVLNAGIKITVYCRGGVQGFKICPNSCEPRTICAEIEIKLWGDTTGILKEADTGKLYKIIFTKPIPENTSEIEGSELTPIILSIEPIKE